MWGNKKNIWSTNVRNEMSINGWIYWNHHCWELNYENVNLLCVLFPLCIVLVPKVINLNLIFLEWILLNRNGDGQNFEQSNFRMADVSYLKMNERSNVKWSILRVIRNIEKTNNSKNWQFFENLRSIANFDTFGNYQIFIIEFFLNLQIHKNLWIYKFFEFDKSINSQNF